LDAVTDHAGRWAGLADWVQGGRTCSPPSDAGPLVGSGADGAHGAGSPRWWTSGEALGVDAGGMRAGALRRAVDVAAWSHEVGEDLSGRLGLARWLVSAS